MFLIQKNPEPSNHPEDELQVFDLILLTALTSSSSVERRAVLRCFISPAAAVVAANCRDQRVSVWSVAT
jgi:hypothetical protein